MSHIEKLSEMEQNSAMKMSVICKKVIGFKKQYQYKLYSVRVKSVCTWA